MNDVKSKINLETIANQLGISKTAVHYAFRGEGGVSAATRRQVLDLAQELGYRPNRLARSLRTRKTDSLGVVLGTLTTSFHFHVLEGIDGAAKQQQHLLLFSCSYSNPVQECRIIESFLERSVDGLIVAPADPDSNRGFYQNLVKDGVKLVFVDRDIPGTSVDLVATDHRLGGSLAVQHLIERRRTRIIVVASGRARSTSIRDRLLGARMALQEAGIDALAVLEGPSGLEWRTDEEYGYKALRRYIIESGSAFDGVFAVNDGVAYGVMRALADLGRRVPEDVSVIGFDDQDPSAYFQPPLTTIRQPMQEIGREAVHLLFRKLQQGPSVSCGQKVILRPELIVRESS